MRWLVVVLIMASGGIAQSPPPEMVERAEALLASPVFGPLDFRQSDDAGAVAAVARRLLERDDPVGRFIKDAWGGERAVELRRLAEPADPDSELPWRFAALLNEVVVLDSPMYTPERFAGVTLSAETRALIAEKPKGDRLKLLHRRLLEGYLGESVGRFEPPRLASTGAEWGRQVDTFVSAAGTASYYRETGQLASVMLHSGVRGETPIGLRAADQAGRDWLAEQGISVDGWRAIHPGDRGEGADWRYALMWVRTGAGGVVLPSRASLTLTAGGQVIDATHVDEPVKVGLEPMVPRDEAVALAMRATDDPAPRLSEARLMVHLNHTNLVQRLKWRIYMMQYYVMAGESVEMYVDVDATTGEVLVVSQPDVAVPPGASQPSRQPSRALPWALAVAPLLAVAAALALRRRRRV